MIIIYIILAISLSLNILFVVYDVLPYIIPALKRKFLKSRSKLRDEDKLEGLILKASMYLIKSKNSKMSWQTGGLFSVIYTKVFQKKTINKDFRNYNYPRGYLFYGLSEYLINTGKITELLEVKDIFDKTYITNKGTFNFDFNKVDQVTFGLISLNLYKIYKEEKYKVFSDNIYFFIYQKYKKDKLVLYRENSICELNDTIGMIVPFLIKYYQINKDSEALKIANNQMEQFIKYGVDEKTFIPSHGYNLSAKIKTGSSNWGRGIGWYFIGLKELYEFNGSYKNEYENICNNLQMLKNEEGSWGQFPGSKNNFDASTTTMFIYCFPQYQFSRNAILTQLSRYISDKGFITHTSGDTEDLNFYSKFSGLSELSQGMLMLILSRYKK